jgi:glycosyltransferase involved in cell wall biosynthesis
MNILLLAPQPFYEERGTPIAVKWVAENMAAAGHAVDLLVFPFGQELSIPGVRLIRCARPPGVKRVGIGFSPQKLLCDVTLVRAARRLLREKKYDVIHACEESIFPALWLARRAGIPLVYDMDSSMADQLMEKWGWLRAFRWLLEGFEKRAMRGADLILPVCQSLAEKVRAFAPGKPFTLLHDQAMQFPAVPAGTEDLRSALGLKGPLVLYVGNLEHYQGIDLLLEGFVVAAGENKAATLVIVGGSARDVETYRARVNALGLAGRVHLLGPRPLNRLSYYLEQADILVSPRLRGVNTPMKVYSYLLAGKAVVATRIVSHTQVMDDTFSCLVEADANALGTALLALMNDPDRRARLGAAAALIAQERHSSAAYRTALLSAYKKIPRKASGSSLDI